MLCKFCGRSMKHIMRFEPDKMLEFERCEKCHYESRALPLKFSKNKTNKVGNKSSSPNLMFKHRKGG